MDVTYYKLIKIKGLHWQCVDRCVPYVHHLDLSWRTLDRYGFGCLLDMWRGWSVWRVPYDKCDQVVKCLEELKEVAVFDYEICE